MRISIRPAQPEEAALLSDLALRSKAHWWYDADFLASCRGTGPQHSGLMPPHFAHLPVEGCTG